MLRNKFNLFLLNLIIYLLYSVAANDSSEEEYNPEESENSLSEDSDLLKGDRKQRCSNETNKEEKKKRKKQRYSNKTNNEVMEGTSTSLQNILAKNKLDQIKEGQHKIFGNEIEIKREFYLDPDTQKIILDNYMRENVEFKEAFERYKQTYRSTKNEIEEAFIQGLCVLHLYGNIPAKRLETYFKMDRVFLKGILHARKIHIFNDIGGKPLKFKNEDEQNGKIEQITELLAAKSKEKCGGKWEFNGEIHFRPLEAKKFFNNILNLARDVEKNKNSENDFLQIIKRNKWYSEFLDSADVKIEGEKQNIQMFMTKFRGIIYDFKWELIWSFKKRSSIYVHNAEESANKICDLLLFRLLLEFLNSMTKNENFLKFFYSSTELDYLEAKKKENIELAYNLIEMFNEYNETPEEFYGLEFNEKYSENTKKMIKNKVEEFIENYIDGKLKVVVDRLKRN